MLKTDDSLNSMGRTLIATDKPTRAKLKQAAANNGLPLSKYLRLVAERDLANKQGGLPEVELPTADTIASVKEGISVLGYSILVLAYTLDMPAEKLEALHQFIAWFDKFHGGEGSNDRDEAIREITDKLIEGHHKN